MDYFHSFARIIKVEGDRSLATRMYVHNDDLTDLRETPSRIKIRHDDVIDFHTDEVIQTTPEEELALHRQYITEVLDLPADASDFLVGSTLLISKCDNQPLDSEEGMQ